MLVSASLLTVLGLSLAVIGAGLLAVPDFPVLRTKIRQGEIELAIHQMKSGGLGVGGPAYKTVRDTLEDLYGINIRDDVEKIQVGITTVKRNPDQEVYIYPSDEDSYTPEVNPNWPYVRSVLAGQTAESEMKFRRTGFLLLGTGFVLQIVANLL